MATRRLESNAELIQCTQAPGSSDKEKVSNTQTYKERLILGEGVALLEEFIQRVDVFISAALQAGSIQRGPANPTDAFIGVTGFNLNTTNGLDPFAACASHVGTKVAVTESNRDS